MNVLIVPFTFYTHFDAFRLIHEELKTRKNNVKYFYIAENLFFKKLNQKYLDFIDRNDLIEVKIMELSGDIGLVTRSINFLKYLINFRTIAKKFIEQNPDVVVLGSDLGGIYIRKIQEICKKKNIVVIIIQTVLFLPNNDRKELSTYFPSLVHFILEYLKLHKIFTFSSDVPGMYLESSHVFALGKTSKEIVESFGKGAKYVHSMGNPGFDIVSSKKFTLLTENNIKNLMKIPPKAKYIVYFTETIQAVYGYKYLTDLHANLRSVFDDLNEMFFIIIKFHPRETDNDRVLIRNQFTGEKYRFIDDIDITYLSYYSEICLAHMSAVILQPILVNKPILNININNSESIIKFPEDTYAFTIQEFRDKLNRILTDESYKEYIINILRDYINANFENAFEGGSTQKVCNKIMEIVGERNG